ncbi:MAG TPA: HWE histidine kinase domain-containing protein [Caulobacteraceae bacterium]
MAEPLDLRANSASPAMTAAGLGEFEWDARQDLLIVGAQTSALIGLAEGATPACGGETLLRVIHEEDRDGVRQGWQDSLAQDGRFDFQFRIVRPDTGLVRWIEAWGQATPAGEGLAGAVGVVRDVTAQRQKENEREALVSELDHRVKNVLASVQSLASQSARRTVSLEAFLKTFLGRIDAMAAAHALLMATRWRGAEIGNIAAAELAGLAHGQARWGGPEILLNPRATNALTLALHELGTNAVKFGALSTEHGRVDVRWSVRPGGGFELVWLESEGPPVPQPSRHGFGRTLLERVTGRELGGAAVLEFRPEGVRATLMADETALAQEEREAQKARSRAVALPADESLIGASEGEHAPYDIRGVRVLIVEDAVLLALELEAGLTEAGAHVVGTAASLEEAQRMTNLSFDVAVLDANLNGQPVIPVAQTLAQRKTPFIFATGYGDAGAAPEGFDAPVVRKPYNVRQIAAALVSALSGR